MVITDPSLHQQKKHGQRIKPALRSQSRDHPSIKIQAEIEAFDLSY
jgi:hypothetical protein